MSIKITIPNSSSDVLTFGSGNTPTAAQIAGIDSGSSNGQLALYTTASGTSTERVRVDSSGNVGIGTASPGYKLDVSATSFIAANISTSYSGAGNIRIADASTTSASAPYIGSVGNNLTFGRLGTAEYARIDSSGNLLVGTTSAGVSNSLSTTIETSGANTSRITVNHSSIAGSSNGSYFMQFGYGGTLSGGIGQASTTTVNFYTGPSDRRLKNNIEDLDSSGEFIDALQPRKWTWTTNGEADVGFVADELQAVLPRCVNGEAGAVDEEGKPVYQMVDASPPEMIANIVAELKAIRKREKEQQAIIQTLTDRITALEGATS